ncbi:carbohydrate ABC transporter permease [Terracoccus luteus]|uniref:Multiple sugar transport system permease protein n=1 Tax=Terracoccus luteus TaxID=53356 RepID=A0A839PV47_9MICO|nr:sugar ABC transporter permease [Terracoccus luteus]MBB2986624.1 multiple sugar transport system permease protein [Terracoccus luteus]MCP2171787.1 multiple sugar transport system permease protein [Terracoccus luteus]
MSTVTAPSGGAPGQPGGPGEAGGTGDIETSRRPRRTGGLREGRAAWVLALPFCLLFLFFTAWPVVQSLFMSFTDTRSRDLRTPFDVNVIGLDNYAKALSDPVFRKAALNTAYFVLIGMPLTLVVALAAAIALDKGITRFRSVFRLGFYMPVITSIVAVAVVWRFLLQDEFGLINTVLGWVGIDGPNWLGDPDWSMPGLILMAAWRNFGTAMIIFLAGLQGVPAQLHEAAAIDGAGAWQRFRHVTLPLLRPTLLFVSVTTAIGYLQFFEEPFVMTSGGPLNSTISLSMYTYKQFGFGNYGLASSMSYLIFVVIAIVTAIQFRLLRERS